MSSEIKTSLGNKIRQWRYSRGLSQQELLAERYTVSYLSKVERDHIQPSDEFLAYVALRLGLAVEELLAERPIGFLPERMLRETQELALMNAHVALQIRQYQKAKNFLKELVIGQLPTSLLADYYFMLGQAEIGVNDLDTAILDLERALKLFESDAQIPPIKVAQAHNSIGAAYYEQGNYVQAIKYHKRCLQVIESGSIKDCSFTMKLYSNLANEYHFTGEHKLAFNYYKEAAKLAEAGEDLMEQANMFWGLGLAYQAQGNMPMAKLYLNKSATIYEGIEEFKYASAVKGILGRAFLERGELEQAEVVLESALKVALRVQDDRTLWTAYINLAFLFLAQLKLEQAEHFAALSTEKARGLQDNLLLGQSLAQLAEVKVAQDAVTEGLDLFAQSMKSLEQSQALDFLQKVSFRYAAALEKLGKVEEAVKIYHKTFEYLK